MEKPLVKGRFICWPKHSSNTEFMAQNKLSFMYMKMTDDGTAKFFLDFELKSLKISFKTKRLCSPSADEAALCFEADITDELRSWLKLFHLEINEDESKIQLTFRQDGTMGHGLYSLRYFNLSYSERSDINDLL